MKAGSFAAMEFSGGSISSHVCAATGAVGCSPSYLQKTRSLCSGNATSLFLRLGGGNCGRSALLSCFLFFFSFSLHRPANGEVIFV